MSASANSLLDRLEQLGLLEESVVADARRMVRESRFEVTADAVAKMLVDDGHLTAAQAKKMLAAAAGGTSASGGAAPAASASSPKPSAPAAPPAPAAAPAPTSDGDDLLGLADDDAPSAAASKPAPAAPAPAAAKPVERPADKASSKTAAEKTAAEKPVAKVPEKPKAPAAPAPAAMAPAKSAKPAVGGDVEDIIVLEEAPKAAPAAPKKAVKRPAAPPSAGAMPPSGGLQPLDGGLMPLGGGLDVTGLDAFGAQPAGLSPMGGAGQDPFGAGGGAPAAQPTPDAAQAAAAAFKKSKARTFDSPFMLLGGGGLVLLLIAGIVLTIILMRGNANELFEAAEADYRSQSYNQAIGKYDKFIANFGGDPKASLARVRRGLAEIRSVVESSKDFKLGLARSKEVIPKIESEEKFSEGRQELAGILPAIADGLAKQARLAGASEKARELVKLTDEALEMVNNPSYIPTSLRTSQQSRIDDIVRIQAEAKRHIDQEDALTKAITDIEAATSTGQTGDAFEIRRSLLNTYPALEFNELLMEQVKKVAARERELVKELDKKATATQEDEADVPNVRRLLISHRRGGTVEKPDHATLFFLANGSVYGLDAAGGQLLWRRAVGYETRVHPLAVGKAPEVDGLIADGSRNELIRVAGRTGKLLWRLAIGERFASPAVVGSKALVTTETGSIWEVDLESGACGRRVQFPQALAIEPGPISATGVTYQVGSHSHLYAVAADKLVCREVFYLGHRAGTIAVPPVMSLNHLVIAENAGPDYSLLHVLATNAEGVGLERPAEQEPIRLSGHVTAPLIQVKNRIIAITNLGEIRVLDVDPTNTKKPVKVAATMVKSLNRPQSSFGLVDGAQIWLGSDRFVSYDIQASRQQLNRRWVRHELEAFIAPFSRSGKTVFHARRRRGSPGVTISAASLEDGKTIWQTDLGISLPLIVNDEPRNQLVTVSAQGDLFRISKEALDAGLLDKPIETAEVEGSATTYSFNEAFPLPGGKAVLFSDLDRSAALVFDPSRQGDELQVVRVDTSGANVTCQPSLLAGAMLLPLDNGQVWLADLSTGKPRVLPFQSRTEPGIKVRWMKPALMAGDQPECVLVDSRQKIYRIGIKDQPSPNLGSFNEADVPAQLITPPAVSVDTVFALSRNPDGDKIHLLPLPGMTEGKEAALGGRLLQGPWQVGSQVIMVSDTEGLLCFGSDPVPRWKMPLPGGPLAAPPRLDGDSLLLASLKGEVWRAALEDGKPGPKLDLKAPLLGAPIPYGDRVLISGADGMLFAIPKP
ncbi:MAG: PQQ-binding-like beta-propeller repeat protein [Planctomycetota bacterium]